MPDDRLRRALAPAPSQWALRPGMRAAAVLAPLLRRGEDDVLVFTRRRSDLPSHAGQISFPGGAREGDESPAACALRETEEELGLRPELVTVLGALPPRASSSRFLVHALVGRVAPGASIVADPREVEAVLEVPLAALLERDRWRHRARVAAGRRLPESPHFDWQGEVIWGLTGRLAYDLVALLC